jgi:tripartite-type tricarboxylate transporter receptor subunit TctC
MTDSTVSRRRTICASLLLAPLLTFGLGAAQAQGYPNQPVKLIVPFSAGGANDVTARFLAEQLTPRLGQPVIVENRPGASAGIGASFVAKAPANGYTLLIGSNTLAANTLVAPTPNLDVINDFEFIGKLAQLDLFLVASPQLKVADLRGLLDQMRSRPLYFGSPGTGSPAHLGVELLKLVTKTSADHVPYKGESGAITDLLGGQLNFMLSSPGVFGPHVQSGALKAIAVAARKRSALFPDVPTTAEAGAPGVEVGVWIYLAAPKGTPAAIVSKLNAAVNDVMREDKFRARMQELGLEAEQSTTPAAVREALEAEIDKWRPVVKAAGIKN